MRCTRQRINKVVSIRLTKNARGRGPTRRGCSKGGTEGEEDTRSCCVLKPTKHPLMAVPVLDVKSGAGQSRETRFHRRRKNSTHFRDKLHETHWWVLIILFIILSAWRAKPQYLLVYSGSSPNAIEDWENRPKRCVVRRGIAPQRFEIIPKLQGLRRLRKILKGFTQQLGDAWETGSWEKSMAMG